jgi:hypothetical protein
MTGVGRQRADGFGAARAQEQPSLCISIVPRAESRAGALIIASRYTLGKDHERDVRRTASNGVSPKRRRNAKVNRAGLVKQ